MEYQTTSTDGTGLRIGIVLSRFNSHIGQKLKDACLQELTALGTNEKDVLLVTVPGALEIPLALQKFAHSGQFDALIALGAVVRGETYHFEVVSLQSASGVGQVSLDYDLPIANGILTTENDAQAIARATEKGRDCARVAIEMANLAASLEYLSEEEEDEEYDDDQDEV